MDNDDMPSVSLPIFNSASRGQKFNWTQVVWLKLDCSPDGSLKNLCKSFFKTIDDLLGTNYCKSYTSRSGITTDDLLRHMARVASIHGLRVLVIDEIQNLKSAKDGRAERMLAFFVHLANTIGVPIVLVGEKRR